MKLTRMHKDKMNKCHNFQIFLDRLTALYLSQAVKNLPGIGGIMLWDVSWDQNNVISGQRYSEYAFKELDGAIVPPVTTLAPPPPVSTQAPPPPPVSTQAPPPPPPVTTQAPPPPTGNLPFFCNLVTGMAWNLESGSYLYSFLQIKGALSRYYG